MSGLNIKAALCVARKDIKILLKERGTVLYLFVVPMVFILGFSGAYAVGGEPEERAITLATVNLDAGSDASRTRPCARTCSSAERHDRP